MPTAWNGRPPRDQAGRHWLRFLGPDAPRVVVQQAPKLWTWRAAGHWANPVGGTVPPAMLADGRFEYVGPEALEPARRAPPQPGRPVQLGLF